MNVRGPGYGQTYCILSPTGTREAGTGTGGPGGPGSGAYPSYRNRVMFRSVPSQHAHTHTATKRIPLFS